MSDAFIEIITSAPALMAGKALILTIGLLLTLSIFLYMDRKVWAAVQMRRGPNVVGPFGLLQSMADFLKFIFKEIVIPASANKFLFLLAPFLSFILALISWAVIPLSDGWHIADVNLAILYIFAVSSLGVYGIIIGGWASNSKYPFLGAIRSAAQMVSYEVSLGLIIINVVLLAGSLNLTDIVRDQAGYGLLSWNWIPLFPMCIVFFISALAETNRPPFDLPEAESELVAGYQVEYSSVPYLLFMIGEYMNITLMSVLTSILFFGGWLPPIELDIFYAVPGFFWLYIKTAFVFFLFAMVKAIVPRYRYDQLMRLGWKIFLPLSLGYVVIISAYIVFIKPLVGA
ncbi:MAG: NADH-quinone oxidoreductase subunit NuoH [Pseudomonadota bacterium]